MKQQTVNEFKDGLNLDLHPLVTPKTVLTDNINGTFITYNGNEFCLQNDRGNKYTTSLTPGYTPIGIKEHNGIIYIVSIKGNLTEIGTYPGINWTQKEGDLDYTSYTPLKNCYFKDAPNEFVEMRFASKYGLDTPITLDVQDSYDGSVNLILVADERQTKIINTAFSAIGNKYKLIDRNQTVDTNYYSIDNFNKETELIRTSNVLTKIDLSKPVQSGGQLKGGNYTFYIKFGDADYNQTDVVAESGIVSIFNGNDGVPSTISGTLLDERTDKMVQLKITGLNSIYSKIYVYFTREYSDTQGYRMTECGRLKEPIDIKAEDPKVEDKDKVQYIWITGFEQQSEVNIEELNVDYHTIDWARAEAQHSNMLFLGNIGNEETFKLYQDLKDWTLNNVTAVALEGNKMDAVTSDYTSGKEYYYTQNIYYNLGYWPDEIYRFGVVYILKDGSTTPVFNMRGGKLAPSGLAYTVEDYSNQYGIFLTPDVSIIGQDGIRPLYFNFSITQLPDETIGWFVVRQKRIPRTICQGLSIGIDEKSHLPLVYNTEGKWDIESFLSYLRDRETDDALLEEFHKYEDKTTAWRWVANSLLMLMAGPISAVVGTIGMIDSAVAAGKLSSLYGEATPAPILEYLSNASGLMPNNIYCAKKISNYNEEMSFADFNADFYANFDEQENAIVDTTAYNKLTAEDTVYCCEYNVSVYTKQEGEEGTNPTWESGETIKVYYLSGNDQAYPDFLNFTYNGEPVYAEVTDVDPSEISEDLSFMNNVFTGDTSGFVKRRIITQDNSALSGYGLISLDPCVNSTVRSILDGSKFKIIPEYSTNIENTGRSYVYNTSEHLQDGYRVNKCVFVNSNTNVKVVDDNNRTFAFSNIAGIASDVSQYKKVHTGYWVAKQSKDEEKTVYIPISESSSDREDIWDLNNINVVRGLYAPYIGVTSNNLVPATVYSIRLLEQNANMKDLFFVRQQDDSEYYCVSNRTDKTSINVFRGDCFTNTVSVRINRNFIDPVAPIAEQIIDEETWAKNVILTKKAFEAKLKGEDGKNIPVKEAIWDLVNMTDVNTVDLGLWVTYKCLSTYNLGLRSLDRLHTDEMAILGSPRSFHPISSISGETGNKMEESFLLNDGLCATVGRKRYNLLPDVPYSKSEFENRIVFSNVDVTDSFTNGYRTFQGLSYKDYDKQYGAITKLIPLGQNLFVVMEHGLGLVPINPKALLQTTTGEAIHIYGYGVLPDEMTIISQDYGSKYEHSVIRTPIGIYGVDVDAKKIWRFSDKQGFETISDMKIETYLKDYLESVPIEIGISDIRTHYNAKKGDIMFTFYRNDETIPNLPKVNYFTIEQKNIHLQLGRTKKIECNTNLPDEMVSFTNSSNLECSYSNKILTVTGLEEGTGNININDIDIIVDVISVVTIDVESSDYINIDYPESNWYNPNPLDENKPLYCDIRQMNTLRGMRVSLPVFLKCPNGRPVSTNDLSAVYSIDRQQLVNPESENPSVINVPKDNHVASTRLYDQCDNYTLPTIIHITEKCFKGTGRAVIRIYNKDKTDYDKCIIKVSDTNPEGTNVSEFKYKNLVWPYEIYVNQNGFFDIWLHSHAVKSQNIVIDDPTAITIPDPGVSLQDYLKSEDNLYGYYISKQFRAGNKPGTYHISFTYPPDGYYHFDGTYTVTVHVLGPDSQIPDEPIPDPIPDPDPEDDEEVEVNYGERSRTISSIGVTEPGGPVIYMTPGSTKLFKTLGNYMTYKDKYPAHWSISENSGNVISFESEPTIGDLQTVINANALGTAKLNLEFKATDREYIRTSYTWTIHVVENIILSRQVVISPSSLRMIKGEKAKVKATVYPSNATYKTVVWDVPQGAVVGYTETGEITARNVGSSRLIATAADNNSEAWITTTVIDPMEVV